MVRNVAGILCATGFEAQQGGTLPSLVTSHSQHLAALGLLDTSLIPASVNDMGLADSLGPLQCN